MRFLLAFLAFFGLTPAAMAGIPVDGAYGFQPAATRIMERVTDFHSFVLVIITIITIFVAGLLVAVILLFNRRRNPEPANFSHNTLIEVIWTLGPVFILIAIALWSFPNLYYSDEQPDLESIAQIVDNQDPNVYPEAAALGWITVKAQGNQWNWTYTFPDIEDSTGVPIEFKSNPLHTGLSTDSTEGVRNLSVDYPLVLPVNRYIRYQTAASDVIHSFAVPAFGIKTDAIPGKLNEGWFLVTRTGTFYGQCSELCGKNHAYMPIEIRVVPQAQYDTWLALMQAGDWDAANASVDTIQTLITAGDVDLASSRQQQ